MCSNHEEFRAMKLFHRFRMLAGTALLLLTMLAVSGCDWLGCSRSKKGTENQAKGAGELHMLVNRGFKSAEEIVHELHFKPDRCFEDMIDLGTALLWTGQYSDATSAFETAARLGRNNNEICGALLNKAGALGYCNLAEACKTIDCAARLQPRNLDIAKLRYALHKKSGNSLGVAAAEDQIQRLDVSLSGNEVCEPITVIAITAASIVAVVAAHDVIIYKLTPPEDRKNIVHPLLEGFHRTASGAIAATSGNYVTLGDSILARP